MRLPQVSFALWFAPVFTHSRAVYNPPVPEVAGSEPSSQTFPGSDLSESYAKFHLPCQADDEAFDFSFQVLEPLNDVACGSSNLLLNGQHLNQDWSNVQWLFADHGRSNLTTPGTINQVNHTLEVSSKSVCLASTLTGAGNSPLPAREGDAVQITFVRIESIDGRPSLSHSGFTVSFDPLRQQIIGVVEGVDGVFQHAAGHLEIDGPISSSIDDETLKLQYLQNELNALRVAVNRQKARVDDLIQPTSPDPVIEFKECHDLACIANTIVQKARHCVHVVLVHLTPGNGQVPPEPTVDPDCYWTRSRQARMSAAKKGEKLCSEVPPPSEQSYNSSATKTQSFTRPSTPSTSPYSSSARTDTVHTILVPIGVIASFLCLSCLTCRLHRHCCNPRARAERAARCEERRTRRQYASLARQHKWRTWWNKRLGRNSKPFSSDYEEKRSLIRAQEQVLDNAAQAEIHRIRQEYGFADEEAAPEPSESLPPYRSRAGSGRPPSYTSGPIESDGSETIVANPVGDVTSGLQHRSPGTPASDMTPDSSIANLSRRNSSDTLHSELSIC